MQRPTEIRDPLTAPDEELCGFKTGPDYGQVMCYLPPHSDEMHWDDYYAIWFIVPNRND